MAREPSLAPGAKAFQLKSVFVPQYNSRRYALAPFCIGHADHGAVGDRVMLAQDLFHFQR